MIKKQGLKSKFKPIARGGWGGWIRTNECRHQKPMPYHLATPQSIKTEKYLCYFFLICKSFFLFFMIFFEKLREKKNKSNKIKVLGESSMQVKMF